MVKTVTIYLEGGGDSNELRRRCREGFRKLRDNWDKPDGAQDEQVLLMTTCMETWIVADRAALRSFYKSELNENQLPPLVDLEGRERHAVQESLQNSTKDCKNKYKKGKRSFEVLAVLTRATLEQYLPSFKRARKELAEKLGEKT